jgi:ABC-2 type transport system ATP-binding protein
MNAIEIKNLTKKYGKMKALDNVNLNFTQGRIIGLLGKNGAGKSTLMRCMLNFLKYTGEIKILGEVYRPKNLHQRIAFIPDVGCLDDRLTVEQTIQYVSEINDNWIEETAERLLAKSNLPLNKKVKALSKGMKTKLYLILTISLDVDILLLDEPTLGLDIVFRKEFFNTILSEFYNEEKTIIISTHQVEEVEHILQDIIFIDNGEIVLSEDIDQLKSRYKIISIPKDREHEFEAISLGLKTEMLGRVSAIVSSDVDIKDCETSVPSLSDLFLMKVGGSNEKV